MTNQEVWSVMHLNIGGVALEDGTPLDAFDNAMMIGVFAQTYGAGPTVAPTGAILLQFVGGPVVRVKLDGGPVVRLKLRN